MRNLRKLQKMKERGETASGFLVADCLLRFILAFVFCFVSAEAQADVDEKEAAEGAALSAAAESGGADAEDARLKQRQKEAKDTTDANGFLLTALYLFHADKVKDAQKLTQQAGQASALSFCSCLSSSSLRVSCFIIPFISPTGFSSLNFCCSLLCFFFVLCFLVAHCFCSSFSCLRICESFLSLPSPGFFFSSLPLSCLLASLLGVGLYLGDCLLFIFISLSFFLSYSFLPHSV